MWKTQLTITTNFICSKDGNNEEQLIHSKSDNVEIMINDEAGKVIRNLLNFSKIAIKII